MLLTLYKVDTICGLKLYFLLYQHFIDFLVPVRFLGFCCAENKYIEYLTNLFLFRTFEKAELFFYTTFLQSSPFILQE